MDYGIAILSTVTDKACKKLYQVQTTALLKATGSLANSSTEVVEILSNCSPLHLHLKLRQPEELLRIHSKHDNKPIKKEFDSSLNDLNLKGKKTTSNMLLSALTSSFEASNKPLDNRISMNDTNATKSCQSTFILAKWFLSSIRISAVSWLPSLFSALVSLASYCTKYLEIL